MQCEGCAETITAALTQIPGVQSAKVSLRDKRAVVVARESEVPSEKILAAIAAAGYQGKPATAGQGTPATSGALSKQPILVNLTRGKTELHAVSMAARARPIGSQGWQAVRTVFLNVEAAVFAAKDPQQRPEVRRLPAREENARRFRCRRRPGNGLRPLRPCRQAEIKRPDRGCEASHPARTLRRHRPGNRCFFLLAISGIARLTPEANPESRPGRASRFLR